MFCWLFKFLISNNADTQNALSDTVRNHVRTCENCRAFYEACLSLGDNLKSRAADFDETLPDHFARRVFDTASTETRQTVKLPVRWLRPALAAACILIVASLATILLTVNHENPIAPAPGQTNGISRVIEDGRPAAWAGLVNKPLNDELNNVTQGTESAVRFLVACVAVNPAKTKYKLTN